MNDLAKIYGILDKSVHPGEGELFAEEDDHGVVHITRKDGSIVMMMARKEYEDLLAYKKEPKE